MALHFRLPTADEEELPNGLHAMWLADHEQPCLIVAVQFRRGRFGDRCGYEGATELAVALIQSGTQSLGHDEFMERLEEMGSALFSEVSEEYTILGCRMLTQYADETLPLFWEMVTTPALAEDEFARLRKEMLAALDAELAEPLSLGHCHFHSLLFGPEHPAGRVPTHQSVRRISIEDVRATAKTILVPQGSTVIVAGDYRGQPSLRPWRELFCSWHTRNAGVLETSHSPVGHPGGVRLVDKPDLAQTTIIVGHAMPGEDHEERYQIALANYVLGGGGFSSRLMTEIRSRMGGAYGISSQVERWRRFGTFSICTATRNEQVGETLEVVRSVYRRFVEEGVTDEELDKAVGFMCGSLAFRLEGVPRVAELFLWLRLYGRGRTEIEHFEDIISRIDRASVNRTIQQYFCPEEVVVVAVGRRKSVERQLVGLGPVQVRDYRSPPD